MTDALAGITVLDVGDTVATGYCGKLFADHGARVINVLEAERQRFLRLAVDQQVYLALQVRGNTRAIKGSTPSGFE